MIEKLFIILTGAVQGKAIFAVGASFLWGILSLVLSPCHLSSIPLIVGFIDEQGRISTKRAFTIALLFGTGLMVSIAVIGLITALAGRMMGDVGRYGNYFVAAIFFLVGLHLLDVIPAPWAGPGQICIQQKGLLAALLLGLIFGIALGPCTFPMLSITFQLAGTEVWYGILLLLSYAVGHCSVIVLAGTFTELVQQYLNWNERSRGPVIVKRVCGVLVVAAGVYLIYSGI